MRFDAVLTGTLRRHAQTLAAIEAGLQARHDALALPGLNEYDSHAIVRALAAPVPVPAVGDEPAADGVREHIRQLREGLRQWMAGATRPDGLPLHAEFAAGVVQALDHVRAHHAEGTVLLVSSGGPIAVAIGHVLGLDAAATIEINLHLRNSALSELKVSPKRHTLITFNTLPHLDGEPASETYA